MSEIADIIRKCTPSKSKGLYVQPYMDASKIASFMKHVNEELGTNIGTSRVHLLFAEKIVRSTVKGIAITDDCLLISMGMVCIFALDSIESVAISGLVNKRLLLGLEGGPVVSFVLTRGNKGARTIAEIIGQYISQT